MKIVISGYGKMGKIIESILKTKGIEYLTSDDIKNVDLKFASDAVCIDFTTPDAFKENYKFIADNFKAAVIGTTGWSHIKDDVFSYFSKKNKTLVYASNFSIGVNIFFKINQLAASMLSELGDYEPYIVEMHHNQKLDAPSGTAKTISELITEIYKKNINVSSVRAGNIPGIHEVGYESEIDRIFVKHEAFSRAGFAQGAVNAAKWSLELSGIYEFKDIIDKKLNKIIKHSIIQ